MSVRASARAADAAAKKAASTTSMAAPQGQWVCLMPEAVVAREGSTSLATMPHPRTAESARYVVDTAPDGKVQLYELQSCDSQPRSWFVGQTVQQDGRLFVSTLIDPLFLALGILTRLDSKMFLDITQALDVQDFPATRVLSTCISPQSAERICDVKDLGGLVVIRLNQERADNWLQGKVTRLAAYLKTTTVAVGSAVQASSLQRAGTEADYLKYAVGMISEYLDPTCSARLAERNGVQLVEEKRAGKATHSERFADEDKEETPEEAAKRAKEDEFFKSTPKAKPAEQAEKKVKLTSVQRSLAKADTKGVKPISSFFGGVGKKK
ncbi:hypothetical protein CAOG_05013 [Capsaspora owczarzaki ATCC 30864]|uniref:hypothetical protein n=1 Tax=Capsaspora owczarzaki (strain ATCC 30864) TaxID=595528 RepID=UPI000352575F|nr:hypothetical protein CAOG_05013 [Capsaspora owczarzaki ATCC 30864]|eukprot:XP_004346698.2 hypothetical protein CAOG_05013 [Capsaspora owczarzaki ATCC 30864]